MDLGKLTLVGAAVMVAAACSSNPLKSIAGGQKKGLSASESAPASRDGFILTALPDARLPAGKCGMILWTLDADRPSPIVRYLAGGKAEFVINGELIGLAPTAQNGMSGFGVFETLQFDDAAGMKISVNIRFGLGFDGGSYLERGIVAVESADGWRSVTPAAGIAGCRS